MLMKLVKSFQGLQTNDEMYLWSKVLVSNLVGTILKVVPLVSHDLHRRSVLVESLLHLLSADYFSCAVEAVSLYLWFSYNVYQMIWFDRCDRRMGSVSRLQRCWKTLWPSIQQRQI